MTAHYSPFERNTGFTIKGTSPRSRDCVAIIFLSFRASEARQGIQYIQQLLDAGFHRHDDFNALFAIATQSPSQGMTRSGLISGRPKFGKFKPASEYSREQTLP